MGLLSAAPAEATPGPCTQIKWSKDTSLTVGQSGRLDVIRKGACQDAKVVFQQKLNGKWFTLVSTRDHVSHLRESFTGVLPSSATYRVKVLPRHGHKIKSVRTYTWA